VTDLVARIRSALADRYAVQSEIGRGGMATVFLAEDLKHGRQVAIKVVHPELAAAVGTDRFLREIETVAGLTHPHILALHDSGEADGLLYYVMPYLDGDSLRDRLEREKQLPVEEAVRIAREVASALDYAHARGIVHRDVKPGNVLFSGGEAVLADFGVARALSTAGGEKMTATGMAVGTPAYMSPEQGSGEEANERSDIYALGCVLYEMLAGEPPLTGVTPQATQALRMSETPPSLPLLRETVPDALDAVVRKALAKAPADRYRSARAFSDAVGSLAGLGVAGSSQGARTTSRRAGGRRAIPWAVLALGAVVLAVALWRQAGTAPGGAEADVRSIAVLPFINMSSDPEQEYFSDGISEELLNLLTKIPELRVTSRSSAFSFKGQNLEIPEIARRLNVARVLEGSVRKDGDQVRITAQLIDARSDTHLWSQTWDRTLDDIFAIQDEIAAEVVAQLKVTLLGAVPTVEETDPQAYALLLQARQVGRQVTAEGFEQSTALYEQALDIDPDYAAAWAGLTMVYNNQAAMRLRDYDEGYRLAREAANRALAIDPEYAPAYSRLGWIAMLYDGDLATAARHYERALELDPTDVGILSNSAILALLLGRLDEAIALVEYVVARDPVNPMGHANLGKAYLWAGRLDEAIASTRTALVLSPGYLDVQGTISTALLLKGEPEAGLAALEEVSSERARLPVLVMTYYALGQAAESDAALAELIDKYEQEAAYSIAYTLAFRGEADRAFEWLDKAVQNNDPSLPEITLENMFANIHDDPRWLPFLESIGMAPDQLAAIEFEVRLPQ